MSLMQTFKKSKAGFTIVELLIVIVVIAILAAISVVAYNGIQARAKLTTKKSEMSTIDKKFANYYVLNNQYPTMPTYDNSVMPPVINQAQLDQSLSDLDMTSLSQKLVFGTASTGGECTKAPMTKDKYCMRVWVYGCSDSSNGGGSFQRTTLEVTYWNDMENLWKQADTQYIRRSGANQAACFPDPVSDPTKLAEVSRGNGNFPQR